MVHLPYLYIYFIDWFPKTTTHQSITPFSFFYCFFDLIALVLNSGFEGANFIDCLHKPLVFVRPNMLLFYTKLCFIYLFLLWSHCILLGRRFYLTYLLFCMIQWLFVHCFCLQFCWRSLLKSCFFDHHPWSSSLMCPSNALLFSSLRLRR
jgi:hypothetical protein